MIPKIHKKGRSFKSSAHYLLHDVAANSNDRVAWTSTRNLATHDPDMAWRVMAATAMDQDRLKAQAGVPNTGRKSKLHVLHFTLSWHPEEAAQLDKREMLRAANTILHVMGAERHQSLLVAHSDQPQPHVHVLVNRVNPRDGRILSSSFEKLKASRWAEAYEKQRGKIYCHERVLNNEARDRGEYTRGEKDDPRPVYEAAQAINDNDHREAFLQEHRKRARLLMQAERKQAARHQAAWRDHEAGELARLRKIDSAVRQTHAKRLKSLREFYRPRWTTLHHEQLAEQRLFEQRETKLMGKVHNALRAIDFKTLLSRQNAGDDRRLETLRGAFQLLADSGVRQQSLRDQQRHAFEQLKQEQLTHEQALREKVAVAKAEFLAKSRSRAEQERNDLVLRQAMEKAKLRTQWLQKQQEMQKQLRRLQAVEQKQAPSPPPKQPVAQPSDLLPKENQQQAARQIDSWHEMNREWLKQRRSRDRDDGRDR